MKSIRTISTIDELEDLIDEVGFLPLFAGRIPGFSVEEHTPAEIWWTEDPETDPWEWRETAARRGHIAYGKFFEGRAGFISKEWFPVFANYRRDGYDFDARWDDEMASFKQKKIMDLFLEENADQERFTSEVKELAGFGKSGEKNFEGTLTSLEMETYLIFRDFQQRKNKKGETYGWSIGVLATPEHIFGRDLVTADYDEDPKDSLKKIVERVKEYCPQATERDILRLVGYSEDRPSGGDKALPYPQNLLKAIDKEKDPWSWTQDQISGLYVALGQLRPKQQRVLREKYMEGKKNEEIGAGLNRAAGTISTYHGKAMHRLRNPLISAWYVDGYEENLRACAAGEHWNFPLPEPKAEQEQESGSFKGDEAEGGWAAGTEAQGLEETGRIGSINIADSDLCIRIGLKVDIFERLAQAGILTVGDLIRAMKQNPNWYKRIYGVGAKTAEDMENKLRYFGLLSQL